MDAAARAHTPERVRHAWMELGVDDIEQQGREADTWWYQLCDAPHVVDVG